MKFTHLFVTTALAAGLFSCNSGSSDQNQNSGPITDSANSVKLELVTDSIHFPVELKSPPDASHRLFIADINGKIAVLTNGKVLPVPFLNISARLEKKDHAPNVQCLYSMEFNPQFASNGKFYVCYNAPTTIDSDVSKMVVSEFTVSRNNPDVADSTTERRIFELEGHTVQNDPCEIAFGPDGYLYIAVGDNGTPMKDRKGEDLNNYLGKLLRIDLSKQPYALPADNPFIGKKNVKPEIWAYGLRRFWRFTFDTATHILIGGDVGDKMQEEVDIITKGANYGWPIVEGDSLRVRNDSAQAAGFTAPIATYGRKEGICIMGGSIYRGQAMPYLQARYVFADLNGNVFALTKTGDGKWVRKQLIVLNKPADPFIINSCNVDKNNEIYLMGTLNTAKGSKGVVYKIVNAF
jgi:glucose/arabinose dehydrogenase